ncbi:MAG TPA: amino acid permease [Anaerolineales bacterium]|jgi:amino acid transporter|nr:amino acid permease [Anaerolineales bacterium]
MNKSIPRESGGFSEEVTLSRDLNLFTITMIGVGGMIGAGIFVLTGIAAGVAGPALVLAFLLNGIVTTFTAMSYAELGSAFPEAGGGYLWVKEGLGGAQGFLAGWMSWFAHVSAGSLYALGFGRFASELWVIAGIPTFGLSVPQLTLAFMSVIIMIFTLINYRGASETGTVGNIVTLTKISILGLFVIFGVLAMLRTDAWHTRFSEGFLPNGILGVFAAMGLTFIAFEGYEIIAQSGEEVINPKRNVPRAIFWAIGIAVTIYIFVSVTAIGATTPPPGMKTYQYLGEQKELAIVDTASQTFPLGIGAVVLLFSGLVSTMSALNATTYSSSRVSFAMGRDHNLPGIFALVHPQRHTPFWAVLFSGGLMLLIAWILPIEDVAASADIMFLLLFLQVNVVVMTLRHKMPDMERGFRVPGFPAVPVIAIVFNAFLAFHLFSISQIAWYLGMGWIVTGLLAYYTYFSKIEAMERPKEILLEEVLVSRAYSVLVPVSTQEQARILGEIGALIARANQGEVLALHVVRVPPQLTLGEGRVMLKEGRPYLDTVIQQAKKLDVPVHTMIRLGRQVAESVRKTAEEDASDLVVLGWPGYTNTAGQLYGSVIDPIVDNPPTDIAVVRYRARRPLRSILVPVAGGPNSRRATRMAINMALSEKLGPPKVILMHVVPQGARMRHRVRAEQVFNYVLEGIDYENIERRTIEGLSLVETILEQAKDCDLIVIGATEEPLFRNLLFGNAAEQVAKRAKVTVILVKRRSGALHSFLRQTVLEPTTREVKATNGSATNEAGGSEVETDSHSSSGSIIPGCSTSTTSP